MARVAGSPIGGLRPARRGFTLIEVLATMVLLGLVLPAVMEGISLSSRLASDARQRDQAAILAQEKINEVLATQAWNGGVLSGDFSQMGWPNYRWQCTVQAWAADTSGENIQQINLQVLWTNNGQQKSVLVSSLAYIRGSTSTNAASSERIMRMPTIDPRLLRHRGFTLLEMIVAMAMVAILATSLYASLRIAFRARAGAVAAVEPARTAQLVLDLVQQDLQNAMNDDTNPTTGVGAGLVANFEGTTGTDNRGREADDVNFYSTTDSPQHLDANGEIKNVELTVIQPQNNPNDHVLIRRVNRNLFLSTAAPPDVEVLCRNVGAFTLQYWNGTTWQPTWDDTQPTMDYQLPVAVMVTLQLDRPIDGNPANTSPANTQSYTYTRVVPLSCSNAAFDPAVNTSYTGSTAS